MDVVKSKERDKMQKIINKNYYQENNNRTRYKVILKQKKIINVARKLNNLEHRIMTIEIINDGSLDNFIELLNHEKVKINSTSLIKKGYITSEEQFLRIIDNFITYFLNIFPTLDRLKVIISLCINSDNNMTLLSKDYLYDNTYIDYYIYNYNLMIINNFYYNAIKFQDELKDKFKQIKLEPKKINLKNRDDINSLINLLEELCFINKNHYALLSLFTKVNDDNYNLYLREWEIIFSNFLDNIDFVHEYQKFKRKTNRMLY